MKKPITIFFLSAYLLASTEACQLLKLPIIFQHFAEHKIENGTISFLQFLDMHYMHGSPKDKDYDRDMQLPFKTSAESIVLNNVSEPLWMVQFSINRPVSISKKKTFTIQDKSTPTSYLCNIWQPPKFC